MPEPKKKETAKSSDQVYETEYRRHRIRIVEPGGEQRSLDASSEAKLFIDDEEFPVEITESGVYSHEMAFKEYGTIDELAEDIIRQRGTATIIKGDQPHHDHGGHDHGDHDHGTHDHSDHATR
ncbi:MAG: hypothetical protein M3440_03230 [Chloroflexota bacterium]|jgi:hypothetical protein|nr:hypothetical protein [Chloroflexota bacterium]